MKRTAFLQIVAVVATFLAANSYASQNPAPDESLVGDWVTTIEVLAEIDEAMAEGKTSTGLQKLESLSESSFPLMEKIAITYTQILEESDESSAYDAEGGYGVALFAEELKMLEDNGLRRSLEERILVEHASNHNACASVLIARGNRRFEEGQLEEALLHYQRALSEHGRSHLRGVVQFNLGIVLRDLERPEEAISAFRALLDMEVNNREFFAESIMQMGYRNYHNLAAINISWCYEKLGKNREAYRWLARAHTEYPHQSWCGTCAQGHERFVKKTADRIALAGPISLKVSHVSRLAASAWYAHLMWFLWIVVVVGMVRSWKMEWLAVALFSAAFALLVAGVCAFLNPDLGLRSLWATGLSEVAVFILKWAPSIIGLVLAAVLGRKHLKTGGALVVFSVVFWVLFSTGLYFWTSGTLVEFERAPLSDIQLMVFVFYLPPIVFLAGCFLTARILWKKTRYPKSRD